MKKTFSRIVSLASSGAALVAVNVAQAYSAPSQPGGVMSGDFAAVVTYALNWILGIIGILAVTGIAIAGIMYVTSGGDEKRTASAKNWLVYSIVGLVVALIGYAIVSTIGTVFGETN